MSFGEFIDRQPRWLVVTVSAVLVVVVGWLDNLTGWEWSLFVLYALPMVLVVRRIGREMGFLFALLCTGVWFVANTPNHPYQTGWGFALAGTSRLFYFAVLVVAVAAAKERRDLYRMRIRGLEHERELEREILRTSEHEKRRIGEDLHDGLGPHLAAISYAASFMANELRKRGQPEADKAEQIHEMAVHAISLARGLARGIFPVQMDGTGLSMALADLAQTTAALTGISISFFETGQTRVEDPEVAMHLFRIAQESMTNALKHGRPKLITIALTKGANSLRLVVADEGKGMDSLKSGARSMGLRSMQYRARALGAELKVESKPNEGTIVSCEVPDARPPTEIPVP